MLAIDTETELIEPGNLTPNLICVSYARTGESGVLSPRNGVDLVRRALESGERIVGHNLVFDMGVLMKHDPKLTPLIFKHYSEGKMRDTMIREQLRMIRDGVFKYRKKGELSLAGLAKKYLRMELDKSEDGWRTRYVELKDKPISTWPKEAVRYAEDDAIATLGVFQCQDRFPDEELQCRAAWALHLLSVRGVITDPTAVEKLKRELEQSAESKKQELIDAGILRWMGKSKPKLTKDTVRIRELVELELGKTAPRTSRTERHPEGQVKIDAKTIQKTKNAALHALVEYAETEKLLTTYVPVLERGTKVAITPRYNVLVETGRTSCSSPNIQNLPRKPGVRECYTARPGFVFAACDYSSAELIALAQVCYAWFGESELRNAINDGKDLNLEMGATLLGISYDDALRRKEKGDEEVKRARQTAKAIMYGKPGGLGVVSLVKYAEGMGIEMTEHQAKKLSDAWFERWPEMRQYFARASTISDKYGPKKVVQYGSGRVRGNVSFTQACNTPFQAAVADAGKIALFEIVKECYVDMGTPLYGSYPVCWIHDEAIVEVPEEKAHAAAKRLEKVMVDNAQKWFPDVKVDATVHLMRRWYKNAEAVFGPKGELIPWEP